MLAIELVKNVLVMSACVLGIVGAVWSFAEQGNDTQGNTLLLLAAIALIVMFNI